MKGNITDKTRFAHILDAIGEVEKYINGISYEDYLINSEKRFACLKQIEIIGEAWNHISNECKLAHDYIQWKPIIAFRNISIHEYFGVNFHIVWEIATYDLPILKQQFKVILEDF